MPCMCEACSGATWGFRPEYGTYGPIPAEVACQWMIEISGIQSVTPSAPCAFATGGPQCGNMNGSWILQPYCLQKSDATSSGVCIYCWAPPETAVYPYDPAGDPNIYWGCCVWASPTLFPVLCQGPAPTIPECNLCFPQSPGDPAWFYVMIALTGYDRTTGAIVEQKAYIALKTNDAFPYFPVLWKRSTALPCKGIAEFSLVSDMYHPAGTTATPNSPFCCDGVPQTIYAYPLS